MANYCLETLEKVNDYLKPSGKKISVHPNSDGTFAIYINGMLIWWAVPENKLFIDIMVLFFHNIYNK